MKKYLADALMITGAAVLSYGAWLVYNPGGYIVGGVLLIAGGIVAARG